MTNLTIAELKEKADLLDYCESIGLEKSPKSKNFICPFCKSGTGKNGTSAFSITKDHKRYKCFSCEAKGDILDLIGFINNTDNVIEQKNILQDYLGIITEYTHSPKPKKDTSQQQPEIREDFSDFYLKAKANNDYEYLESRGIDRITQDFCNVGLVDKWVNPKGLKEGKEYPKDKRVIIPRTNYSYLARAVNSNDTYSKQVAGEQHLFNEIKAFTQKAIFVVEGEIDAMSLMQSVENKTMPNVIALGSTSNYYLFLQAVNNFYDRDVDYRFILMLDNDNKGQLATKSIVEYLEQKQLPYLLANENEDYKNYNDPNEFLLKDKETFKKTVFSLYSKALKLEKPKDKNNASELLKYFDNMEFNKPVLQVKTGFRCFDREDKYFYGGLPIGLYFLGAVSSLGKTTFTLQLAQQIAQQGQDVIFFSLEMSSKELLARLISRETSLIAEQEKIGEQFKKSSIEVLLPKKWQGYTEQEIEILKRARLQVGEKIKDKLTIYETENGIRLTVEDIKNKVEEYKKKTGKTPVVFIDYLQIIKPSEELQRATDKQIIDNTVEELKQIQTQLKTIVFVISSFNRESYYKPVDMSSFKESGAIEYTSDVLFGLQLKGMEYETGEGFNNPTYKKRIHNEVISKCLKHKELKMPVEIELKCLKNRNGGRFSQVFNYTHAYNDFAEDTKNEF